MKKIGTKTPKHQTGMQGKGKMPSGIAFKGVSRPQGGGNKSMNGTPSHKGK